VSVVLKFGRHRGKPLEKVTTSYLRWLVSGCDRLDGQLLRHARAELERRGDRYLPADAVLDDLEDLIAQEIDADPRIDHEAAALLSDAVLVAFERLRRHYGVGSETDLVVPGRPRERFWEGTAPDATGLRETE
jgi:hypothetical protein